VDSAFAADLLLSTTAPGLGYLHQTPDALQTKIQHAVKFFMRFSKYDTPVKIVLKTSFPL
jgi:hypothetical protein